MIILTIISILAVTCAVWTVNKLFPFKVCPICAGVSGTWLWMLVASLLGYQIDLAIVAMLMGGSVVGIAYQLEKRLPTGRSPLLWKMIFIPLGFVAVYGVVSLWWTVAVPSLAVLGLLSWVFVMVRPSKAQSTTKVEALKKKMQNCC